MTVEAGDGWCNKAASGGQWGAKGGQWEISGESVGVRMWGQGVGQWEGLGVSGGQWGGQVAIGVSVPHTQL